MAKVPEIFGSMVFNDQKMQERLPKSTYKALKKTIQNGEPLDLSVANVVAAAMKDWAVEMGCTHYTHWFQPMTGITAEKHDSFIAPNGEGQVIMEFSGKELVKASLMLLLSQAAVFVPHSRQEAIQHGIRHHMHSLRTEHFIFLQHSVLIQARFSIRKLLFFVQWRELIQRL